MSSSSSRIVWVNRRSGVAHESVACRWLLDVPVDRLRTVSVETWPPRLRLCPSCFPRDEPAERSEATRLVARAPATLAPSTHNRASAPDVGVSPAEPGNPERSEAERSG